MVSISNYHDQTQRIGSDAQSKQAGDSDTERLAAGLYVVATPIGNAADITLRALRTLSLCDVIACEDTRVTSKLLAIHGLRTPLKPYHDHNSQKVLPGIVDQLRAGARVALVSDAGTPLVSDPGFRLVNAALAEGIPVVPLPGASSVLAALCVSGLPTDRFLFVGFPPSKPTARRRFLADIAHVPATIILLESTQRLGASLADLAAELGPRSAAVCRELTKRFEEVRRGPLAELAEAYLQAGPPKGEVTVVIAPPNAASEPPDQDNVDALLRTALTDASVRSAAARVAAETGLPRRTVYTRALLLAQELDKPGQ